MDRPVRSWAWVVPLVAIGMASSVALALLDAGWKPAFTIAISALLGTAGGAAWQLLYRREFVDRFLPLAVFFTFCMLLPLFAPDNTEFSWDAETWALPGVVNGSCSRSGGFGGARRIETDRRLEQLVSIAPGQARHGSLVRTFDEERWVAAGARASVGRRTVSPEHPHNKHGDEDGGREDDQLPPAGLPGGARQANAHDARARAFVELSLHAHDGEEQPEQTESSE